jgi:hypothetical protein
LVAHGSQLLASFAPAEQMGCAQLLVPPPQLSPQIDFTSPTHCESQDVEQQ